MAQLNPVHVVIAGVLAGIAFVLLLLTVVKVIVN